MAVTPPKTAADIQAAGGRHYRGRGLGQTGVWKCPACGLDQSGLFTQGCVAPGCGAGAPGTQVRKPGEPAVVAAPKATGRAPATRPGAPASLADQLRRRASAIDYDEIERRVLSALDSRLGGGYTAAERARLYEALECTITLWENGDIEPVGGLSLDQTRQLAMKVAPDEGLEFEETDGKGTTTPTPAGNDSDEAGDSPGGEYAGEDDGTGDPGPGDGDPDAEQDHSDTRSRHGSPEHPAPEFVDADPGGDEGR